MNYKKIYYQIIDKAKERNYSRSKYKEKNVYVERHHITPKSLGGSDSEENFVFLTTREHFICHYLLVKMFKDESNEWYKMNCAFLRMKSASFCQSRYYNSRLYEALKGNHSSVMSFLQTGSKNSNYGKMWISNIDLKQNKTIKRTDEIPEGWVKGRYKWRDRKTPAICMKDIKYKAKKEALELFDTFMKSDYDSINKFAKSIGVSHVSVVQRFQKYVPGYKDRKKSTKKFKAR
jgi:hypothetical protein